MTKKRGRPRKGITDGEFEQLVDEGFATPPKRRRGGARPVPILDAVLKQLEIEGRAEGLNPSAARFHGLMGRCLNVSPHPPTPEMVKFLNGFDSAMRVFAKARGVEVDDD